MSACSSLRSRRAAAVSFYVLSLAGAVFLVSATFLAPWLAARNSGLSDPLYRAFSHVCHQLPSRCLSLFGHPMAVCGRCLGVYMGVLAGCLVYPFCRGVFNTRLPARRLLITFSLPLAIDVLGNFLRLWNSGTWLRLAAGLSWGVILPFFFLPAMTDLAFRGLAILKSSK